MTERVLLTGSSGFIGTPLLRSLNRKGYDALGLDIRSSHNQSSKYDFIVCDILDLDKLRSIMVSYQPTIVIHLAARTDLNENRSLQGYAVNIDGTKNLIKAIEDAGCVKRALFTSSQLVCRVGYIPKSDTDYRPSNLYGESKVLSEKIVRESNLPGVTWSLLRPTTIWGEGMSPHYQRFLRLVKQGRYVHIGKGPLNKSYGYIGNTVHQYLRFIEAKETDIHRRTFYLADYRPLSLRQWVDSLAARFGAGKIKSMPVPIARVLAWAGDILNLMGFQNFPFNSFRLNNILTEYIFDLSSTEKICGCLPYSLSTGVEITVKWFDDLERKGESPVFTGRFRY